MQTLRAAEVGYIVTTPITWEQLVDDDIPSWPVVRFQNEQDARAWVSAPAGGSGLSNWDRGFKVLLPVIPYSGDFTEVSIGESLHAMGVPEPVQSLDQEIDDAFEIGVQDVDGENFLDNTWRFSDITLRLKGARTRHAAVEGQIRAEFVLLEKAFRTVHGKLAPPPFWSSRQVRESLLMAARRHRDRLDRLATANLVAWKAFQWGARELSVLAADLEGFRMTSAQEYAEASASPTQMPERINPHNPDWARERRQLVDRCIDLKRKAGEKKFSFADIWQKTSYKSRTQPERWLSGRSDAKGCAPGSRCDKLMREVIGEVSNDRQGASRERLPSK
jgi:hypothetical protein